MFLTILSFSSKYFTNNFFHLLSSLFSLLSSLFSLLSSLISLSSLFSPSFLFLYISFRFFLSFCTATCTLRDCEIVLRKTSFFFHCPEMRMCDAKCVLEVKVLRNSDELKLPAKFFFSPIASFKTKRFFLPAKKKT